jgi:hypothetical protein
MAVRPVRKSHTRPIASKPLPSSVILDVKVKTGILTQKRRVLHRPETRRNTLLLNVLLVEEVV